MAQRPSRSGFPQTCLQRIDAALYMVWLLLPAVQTSLHAVTGALAVALYLARGCFWTGKHCPSTVAQFFAARAVCGRPCRWRCSYFLERGGGNLAGYYAQQGMFWFPLLWCAYARERGDALLYRFVKAAAVRPAGGDHAYHHRLAGAGAAARR